MSSVASGTGVHRLRAVLEAAAAGVFPPADAAVEVVGSPPGPCDAVVAFSAHHVVAADVPPDEVSARVDGRDLGVPMSAGFLSWLADRLGTVPGSLDVTLAAVGTGAGVGPSLDPLEDDDHPRVRRALAYRREVRAFGDAEVVVVVGRGLAERWEVAIELDPAHRGRGRGVELARAALGFVPAGDHLFAQVSPGNVASIRAFLAAGYRPIGGEVLFLKR